MPKVFFISYARDRDANPNSPGLEDRFEVDLRENVSSLLPNDNERVGFRDARDIEAGTASWENELAAQLAAYPVGIVLLSPAYLERRRPWCKWECRYLDYRNALVSSQTRSDPPRLLLILHWVKPDNKDIPAQFPGSVQHVDESIADSETEALKAIRYVLYNGLRNTLQLVDSGDATARPLYTRFLQTLAKFVVAQFRRWEVVAGSVRNLLLPPRFSVADVWTPVNPTTVEPPKPRPDRAQRRRVYVVYLAAPPSEVSPERAWRYRDGGEEDWQPFAGAVPGAVPTYQERHVSEFVEDLSGVVVTAWPFMYFCEHMEAALSRAGHQYPVLFIIDPWTTCQLERYRKALEQYVVSRFDERFFCSPIVIWNAHDSETVQIRSEFERSVGALFNRNRWEPVIKVDEFTETLDDIINLQQRKIRNVLADESPRGGSDPPRISAFP